MLRSSEIAQHLISCASERGNALSNLKLQKLLYYAQAWHLAIYDRRLFADQIEAGENGPGLPLVYEDGEKQVVSRTVEHGDGAVLDDAVRDHLDCMMEKYGSMTEVQLQVDPT